jgi:hypothetical protein
MKILHAVWAFINSIVFISWMFFVVGDLTSSITNEHLADDIFYLGIKLLIAAILLSSAIASWILTFKGKATSKASKIVSYFSLPLILFFISYVLYHNYYLPSIAEVHVITDPPFHSQ